MKPIIAKLPASERQRASDSLAKEMRKHLGVVGKGNDVGAYRKMANPAKPKAQDSATSNLDDIDRQVGKDLAKKYNPHYKGK